MSLIAAAIISRPRMTIRPSEIAPLSIASPLRGMAYQSVTMFRATRRLAFRGPADMRRGDDRPAALRHRCADRRRRDRWREPGGRACALRSEEHTSELQSLMRISYAVFCLKKKTT